MKSAAVKNELDKEKKKDLWLILENGWQQN